MNKRSMRFRGLWICVLLFVLMMAACSSKDTSDSTDEKKTISMFMINSGLEHPDGIDPEENPWINIVKEYANVDLALEIPPYADWSTRFNLMLASGELPDVVHASGLHAEIYKAANEGAFIDLKEYYDQSPIVQAVISPEMMELAKDLETGSYWRIPMAWDTALKGSGFYTRYDLIEKYHDGVWPKSVDEWVEVMRKIKAAEPDSLILSTRPVGDSLFAYGGRVIFDMYGAQPYGWRVMEGEIIPNVVLPEYRAATEKMRELYEEGLVDPEFATNDGALWFEKLQNQNVLMQWNGADQLPAGARNYLIHPDYEQQRHYKWAFAPPLEDPPAELADPRYAYGPKPMPISGHGLYISHSASDPDRAWKVIEGFASEQLYEAIFWGEEGVTYEVVDGERVPDADQLADASRRWSLHLAILWGFQNGQEVQRATTEQVLGEEYAALVYDSIDILQEKAEERGLGDLVGYLPPNEAAMKIPESMQAINKFTVEAITGRISMEQFDTEVQKWEEAYRELIYDPMQAYMEENAEYLRSVGFHMMDW